MVRKMTLMQQIEALFNLSKIYRQSIIEMIHLDFFRYGYKHLTLYRHREGRMSSGLMIYEWMIKKIRFTKIVYDEYVAEF